MSNKVKDIKVKKELTNSNQGFYIDLEWMYGDADGYNNIEFGGFSKDQKDLLYDAIETCERMKQKYKNTGKGGFADYREVEGFSIWFDEDSDEYNEEHGSYQEYCPDGYGCVAELTDYSVYYYENGKKYECEIKFE